MTNDAMSIILDKYVAAHPTADKQLLADFCQFARTWFLESNVVGVGVNDGGIALRLGDGSATNLFSIAATPMPAPTAVHITGTAADGKFSI